MKSFFVLLAAFAFLGCVEEELSFVEVVKETPGGEVKSFELFVVSNGVAFQRIEGEKVEIKTFNVGSEKAKEIMSLANNLKTYSRASKDSCDECTGHQIFLKQKEGISKFFFNNSPEYATQLFEETKNALEGEESDAFLLRFAFQKIGSNVVDFHVFGDGTVVRSEFGSRPGDLKSSKAYALSVEKIERIKEKISVQISQNDDLKKCPKAGFTYGYFESVKNAEYSFSFTCGAQNTMQSEWFNFFARELN